MIFNGRNEGEHYAYQRGLAEGNAAATAILVGCKCKIRLVVDTSLAEGTCELRVPSAAHIHAPSRFLDLMMMNDGD